jgi:hypothetical protein
MFKFALISLLVLLPELTALGQSSGGPYTLTRESIDGGTGRASGGIFELRGTLGQPDAAPMRGGVFALNGGFHRAALQADAVFKNGFE